MKYIAILLFICTFLACQKNSNDTSDITKPMVSIVMPTTDSLKLSVDSNIHIQFGVVEETSLHSLTVLVFQNGIQVYQSNPLVHGLKTFAFQEQFSPNGISVPTAMKVRILAMDTNENQTLREIDFVVSP